MNDLLVNQPYFIMPPTTVSGEGIYLNLDRRVDINELELAIYHLCRAGYAEERECPITHKFTPGLYTREMFVPAGSVITGRTQNTVHPWVMLSGSMMIYIEHEGFWKEVKAGDSGITVSGTRRAAYAPQDAVFVTYHPTELTDPDLIMETISSWDNPLMKGMPSKEIWREHPREVPSKLEGQEKK